MRVSPTANRSRSSRTSTSTPEHVRVEAAGSDEVAHPQGEVVDVLEVTR